VKWIVFIGFGLLSTLGIIAGVGYMLPKHHVASRHMELRQPPDAVYALIAGPSTWRKDVKKYEPMPQGGGKLWMEVDNYDNEVVYERVEDAPPRRLVTRIAGHQPYSGTWTYDLARTATGTDLRITENGEVYNPIFRFLSRFVFGHSATIDKYLNETAQHFGETPRILP
jgi:hypothetical protein